MNKRIKNLAEAAGFCLWGEENWNPGDVVDWGSRYDRELVKFHKLAVEEVIQAYLDKAMSMIDVDDPKTIDWANGTKECVDAVRKQFGVK